MAERVLVGFSGGVDSAMTALLLRERGHPVVGAMMLVRDSEGRGCGGDGDAEAAAGLAETIGIPFKIFDCSDAYRRHVLDNFRDEYLSGRTPNPCVRCNPLVKFGVLPVLAREAGVAFDLFATGHYARIRRDAGGPVLMRGVDATKDQSYFLYRLTPEQLEGVRFPLGGMTKREVRRMAEERGAPVFDKPDSQDFYGGDYAALLGVLGKRGEIVMDDGRVVGEHEGCWNFTVGQRKGLGIAWREPLYVIRLEAATNRVVVGTREKQLSTGCVVSDLIFDGKEPGDYLGRVRSAQPLREMRVLGIENGEMRVQFAQPIQGVAPGQSLVLYNGDDVVGGGIIRGSL